MALSAYDPCPCDSGKKLKFCCQAIVDDMDRATRLMEGNQPRVALQQLESLSRKHPQNSWIATTRALILMELNEPIPARDILKASLEHNPDHEFSIGLMAAASFQAEGMEAAKRSIHRAFQRSAKKFPQLVSGMAAAMSSILDDMDRSMAAREHLALALRLAPEEHRQELFVQLLEFDGDTSIPYPLRGSHQLPQVTGNEEQQKELKKAQKYALVGCWNTAAELFAGLTKSMGDLPELWHCVGLCRAWDGNHEGAAEALHRASSSYGDFSTAVECETMAQLLDESTTTDVEEVVSYTWEVESVSRLLTLLDQQPNLDRQGTEQYRQTKRPPAAVYVALNQSKWTETDFSKLTLDNCPQMVCQLAVFDLVPDVKAPAVLVMSGDRGADVEAVRSQIESLAGTLIRPMADEPQPDVRGTFPRESSIYRVKWNMPQGTPVRRFRELRNEHWSRVANTVWPAAPRRILADRSPRDAAADASKKVSVTAAAYVLDATASQSGVNIDLDGVLSKLGLTPLPTCSVQENTPLAGFSVMQMERLPLEQLTDGQLNSVVNRALLIHHNRFLRRVLVTALERPSCKQELELPRVYNALVEMSMSANDRASACRWLEESRRHVPAETSAFEHGWACDLAELKVRLEDPADPELRPLLNRIAQYYGPKVPQMRPYVERMLAPLGIESPWNDSGIVTASSIPAPLASGVWSPNAPAQAAPAGKLWLPGQ